MSAYEVFGNRRITCLAPSMLVLLCAMIVSPLAHADDDTERQQAVAQHGAGVCSQGNQGTVNSLQSGNGWSGVKTFLSASKRKIRL